MKIELQDSKDIQYYFCGYYQFEPKGCFDKVVLGVGEKEIKVYSDNMPDSKIDDVYSYNIKYKIDLSKINVIYNEKIENNKDLKGFYRLNVIMNDVKNSFLFYYNVDELFYVKQGLKKLKKSKIKIKKDTIDLSVPY